MVSINKRLLVLLLLVVIELFLAFERLLANFTEIRSWSAFLEVVDHSLQASIFFTALVADQKIKVFQSIPMVNNSVTSNSHGLLKLMIIK